MPRSSPSSATSATRSAAPTRRREEFENEYEAWCSPESPIFEALESGDLDLTTGEMPEVLDADGNPIDVGVVGPVPAPAG